MTSDNDKIRSESPPVSKPAATPGEDSERVRLEATPSQTNTEQSEIQESPEDFKVPQWTYLDQLGVDLPNLSSARDETVDMLSRIAIELRRRLPIDEGVDVVAFGSLARLEASGESDFDYLLIAHALAPPDVIRRYRLIVNAAGFEIAGLDAPGTTGMFGKVISGGELTQNIGLEEDTNVSHTRRMLLLEESVSLYLQRRHRHLIENILQRYLLDYELLPKTGVPRFLLNDVARYWRQITVDYQAKRWAELPGVGPEREPRARALKWGLRYLKLLLSRKVVYAGTVASLLLVEHEASADQPSSVTLDKLLTRFTMTPLDRLAELKEWLTADADLHALRTVVGVADWFSGRLADPEFRVTANQVLEPRDPANPAAFKEAKDKGEELQTALEHLFFETELLRDLSKQYLAF